MEIRPQLSESPLHRQAENVDGKDSFNFAFAERFQLKRNMDQLSNVYDQTYKKKIDKKKKATHISILLLLLALHYQNKKDLTNATASQRNRQQPISNLQQKQILFSIR